MELQALKLPNFWPPHPEGAATKHEAATTLEAVEKFIPLTEGMKIMVTQE